MNIVNKKAHFDYFISEEFEAGLVLEGWEVKSIKAGRVQINDAYVKYIHDAFYIVGMKVTPLISSSTHIKPDADRFKKILLNQREINKLIGKTQQDGFTIAVLNIHFSHGKLKANIGLAKGKKNYDKRQSEKNKDWERSKQQIMKMNNR